MASFRSSFPILYTDDLPRSVAFYRDLAAGVRVLAAPADHPWGERLVYVEDPDGNRVHITAPTAR